MPSFEESSTQASGVDILGNVGSAGDIVGRDKTVHVVQSGASSITNINKVFNQQDPAVLAETVKFFTREVTALTEAKIKAEAKAAELAAKLGFTSDAVAAVFKVVGKKDVPEESVSASLIEFATDYARVRDALAALKPDNPHAAELARQASEALDSGRLLEANALLERSGPALGLGDDFGKLPLPLSDRITYNKNTVHLMKIFSFLLGGQ